MECSNNMQFLFRPPFRTARNHRSGRAYVLPVMFFLFFSPRFLRDPSTDRPETLPHDQNLAVFYKLTSKILGVLPPKNFGPKTCKIALNFGPHQTLISNISGTRQHIQNQKDVRSREIPPTFNEKKSGELWSTNGLELHVSLDPLKSLFGILYLGP